MSRRKKVIVDASTEIVSRNISPNYLDVKHLGPKGKYPNI